MALTMSELEYLKKAVRDGRSLKTIARNLRRSKEATRKIIARHGLSRPGETAADWSTGEIAWLGENYGAAPMAEIYEHFPHRTPSAVRAKACRLGLVREVQDVEPVARNRGGRPRVARVRRRCMTCSNDFLSEGIGNRICTDCKKLDVFGGMDDFAVAAGV